MSDVGRRRRCSGGRPCGRGGRACGPDVAAEHRRRDEDRRRRRPCARGRLGRRSGQARVIEAGAMGQRGRQRRRSRGVEQGEGGGGRRWGIWHERGRTQRCLDEGGGSQGQERAFATREAAQSLRLDASTDARGASTAQGDARAGQPATARTRLPATTGHAGGRLHAREARPHWSRRGRLNPKMVLTLAGDHARTPF